MKGESGFFRWTRGVNFYIMNHEILEIEHPYIETWKNLDLDPLLKVKQAKLLVNHTPNTRRTVYLPS